MYYLKHAECIPKRHVTWQYPCWIPQLQYLEDPLNYYFLSSPIIEVGRKANPIPNTVLQRFLRRNRP